MSVEVGEKQAAVDIGIVADYGVSMHDLANGMRRNVIAAIERMTGLEVTEVNVTVHDVVLFDENGTTSDGDSGPRSSDARAGTRSRRAGRPHGALAGPDVADLHGGMFGEVATYLPGASSPASGSTTTAARCTS